MSALGKYTMVGLLAGFCFSCSNDKNGGCDLFDNPDCIEVERIKTDVERLAAADMAGRRAGRPGNDAAVGFAEARFREVGVAPPSGRASHRQSFPLSFWTPTSVPQLRLGRTDLTLGVGFETVEFSGNGTVQAETVFAGYGMTIPPYDRAAFPSCPVSPSGYDDFAGVDVAGRIAVIMRRLPGNDSNISNACPSDPTLCSGTCVPSGLETKARNAFRHGAVAVLFTSPSYQAPEPSPFYYLSQEFLTDTGGRLLVLNVNRTAMETAIPSVSGWAAAIDSSKTPSSHATGVEAALSVEGSPASRTIDNVLGAVPGEDARLRDEVIVIGAHVDHLGKLPFRETYFPGADDNASGTAVVLELARALVQSPTHPKRTVLFAVWNAEESFALPGSYYYTDFDPVLSLANTKVMFSVDMVGLSEPGIGIYGGTVFTWIPQLMTRSAAQMRLPWPVTSLEPNYGSDHAFFAQKGIPAVLALTSPTEAHRGYHTPYDTPDRVRTDTLEAAAKLLWAALRPLSLGTEDEFVVISPPEGFAMPPMVLPPRGVYRRGIATE